MTTELAVSPISDDAEMVEFQLDGEPIFSDVPNLVAARALDRWISGDTVEVRA